MDKAVIAVCIPLHNFLLCHIQRDMGQGAKTTPHAPCVVANICNPFLLPPAVQQNLACYCHPADIRLMQLPSPRLLHTSLGMSFYAGCARAFNHLSLSALT